MMNMNTVKLNNGVEMPQIGYGARRVRALRRRCAERGLSHD